jgi:hypothetical protein
MSYDLSGVRERVLKEGSIEESRIDMVITEFRRFLGLCLLGNGFGMTSREVDAVWHTFILFTRDYHAFCEEVFGHYLHHQPTAAGEPVDSAAARDAFRRSYEDVFGTPPPSIWGSGHDCDAVTCGR